MESIVATIIELCKCAWPSISEFIHYQKIVDEKHRVLEKKMEDLRARKLDIDAELQAAQVESRKKRRVEVGKWLKDVENKEDEARNIMEKVRKRRCFSRSRFLRQIQENIEKASELIDQGASFLRGGAFIELHQVEAVKLITTELIGESTAEINLKKIWACLEKGEIQPIGVWGMGGMGKTTVVTHIHNRLLEKEDIFGPVYWVTVSKESSIRKLQDAVAQKIGLRLSEEEDEKIRSSLLFNQLQGKKFVLILDDVWENYTPQGVGIPTGADGGKLIITTRSLDVCKGMGCKEIIKMEPLPPREALDLFKNTLKPYHGLSEEKEEMAKEMVRECDGLPLAIVVVAGMMKNVDDISEWRNALRRLKGHMKGNEMEESVFKILRYSFTSLDKKHQGCLLYCALFPEDYEISRVSLIRYWIAEGLVDEMEDEREDWLAEFDDGCATLNKLERLCLLEKCSFGRVKMHDVIRDMAINISAENCRFMVKAGRNLNGHASQREWSESLERVSFMDCTNLSLTSSIPNCPRLSTLLLQRTDIVEVPETLFEQMRGLKVLDLTATEISFLPDSVSDLVNLRALLLFSCSKLKHVPSLAKLKELRELDLTGSGVEAVPDGIEKLVLLKRLSLRAVSTKDMSLSLKRALPNLRHLQCLRLDGVEEIDVEAELIRLTELKILGLDFSSLRNFNSYLKTRHCQNLLHYRFTLIEEYISEREFSGRLVKVGGYEEKEKMEREDKLVLPTNIQLLEITNSVLPTSLMDVFPSLQIPKDLKQCEMKRCGGIEYLWCTQGCCASLHSLYLHELPDLRVLFKLRTSNYTSFFSLKRLFVNRCDNIEYMFTPGLVKHHLQNLQQIQVARCSKMKDIIASATVEEEREKDMNEINNLILCFPNLLKLHLGTLPKLESIWKGTMTCDSLQEIKVSSCPKLKRLPISVSVHIEDGEGRASTPPLQKIKGDEEWWNMVEWDTHPDAKSVFQPLFLQIESKEIESELARRRIFDDIENEVERVD